MERVESAIEGFMDPFDPPPEVNPKFLYRISSGCPVPQEIEKDVFRSKAAGKEAREKFVRERLHPDTRFKPFYAPIKNMKIKTMGDIGKAKKRSAKASMAVSSAEQNSFFIQTLTKAQTLEVPIELNQRLTYPINDVPCAFGTPDGFFNKTNKATIVHHLSHDYLTQSPAAAGDRDLFYIEDGNAHFHSMTNIPDNFKDIGLNILDSTSKKKNMIFSTDDYLENSIEKSLELKRRAGETEHEVLVISGENMKRPLDFKLFLQTGANKIAFCKLLLQIFGSDYSAARLAGRNFIYVVQGHVYQIDSDGSSTTVTELEDYYSNQEETDSRIIVYLKLVESVNDKATVIIHSPDSDVFILLLYYSHKFTLRLLLDTGSGDNRRLIDVTALGEDIGEVLCRALLALYIYHRRGH